MRKGLWLVTAVALLGTSAAMAQDQGQRPGDHGGPPPGDQGQRPGDRPAGPAMRPAGPAMRPADHRPPVHRRPPPAPGPGRRPSHRFLSGGAWRHSIHGPAFRYPPGFSYRAWAAGGILPPVFLTSAYFYGDYAALGLAPPPPGYQWVRYGPDILMVNISTGRIADVVDGVFY